MRDLLIDELIYFLKKNDWNDDNVKEKARAIFTTICVVWNFVIGGGDYEGLLEDSYNTSNLKDVVNYYDYCDYMTEITG